MKGLVGSFLLSGFILDGIVGAFFVANVSWVGRCSDICFWPFRAFISYSSVVERDSTWWNSSFTFSSSI